MSLDRLTAVLRRPIRRRFPNPASAMVFTHWRHQTSDPVTPLQRWLAPEHGGRFLRHTPASGAQRGRREEHACGRRAGRCARRRRGARRARAPPGRAAGRRPECTPAPAAVRHREREGDGRRRLSPAHRTATGPCAAPLARRALPCLCARRRPQRAHLPPRLRK